MVADAAQIGQRSAELVDARPAAVSVGELKAAWIAIQAGQFRTPTETTQDVGQPATLPGVTGWVPGPGERVLIERATNALASVRQVPAPRVPDLPVALTVLDVGWDIGQVAATPTWLGVQVRGADLMVLVTRASVPGLRRLESALDLLAGVHACAAVLGPKPKKWPRPVRYSAGPLTRALLEAGRLFDVPADRGLAIAGLDATPLPAALQKAAATLLHLLPTANTTTRGETP